MKQREKDSLFIVDSPFQCLCMLEAIHYFKLENYDVIVAYCNNNSLVKVDRLLKEQGISYNKLWLSHLLYDTIPLVFKTHKKYNRFFIGNYCSPHSYALSVFYAKFGARVCYMDDGTQVLSLFSDNPPPKKYNWKVESFMAFINILHRLKKMGKDDFFTIYDVQSEKYNIIHNPFSSLVTLQDTVINGIYIIGTNTSIVMFKGIDYETLLTRISIKYRGENIFYCPHRQDPNNDKIFAYCEENGIKIFNTSVSVEYDFVKNSIYPAVILGFNSNALYTLHQIFPQSECVNIYFELSDPALNEEYKTIRIMMARKGIKSVDLLGNK